MKLNLRTLAVPAVLLFLLAAVRLNAQLTTATILGTVSDPSGATIPGASVTATNMDTHFTRTVSSNEQGDYRLDYLPVGTYEVKVQAQGFKAVEQKPLTLTLNAEVHFNATLQMGGSSETITVTAGAPLIQIGSVSYYLDGGLNMTFIRNTGNILPNPDALPNSRSKQTTTTLSTAACHPVL
jgi:hypothetical protein